jgi:UDPglucose 6-dehydrogenase
MNISVIGGGYVGLTTSVGLASKGHMVTCVDIDENKVSMINRAEPPFYQDQLAEILHTHVKQKRNLRASSDYDEVLGSDVTFICVNTSSNGGKNSDFGVVRQSATRTAEALRRKSGYHLVVMKSSVVPGTTEGVVLPILEQQSCKKAGEDFGIAVNPEFLREGEPLHSFLNSDRIIIGQYDQKSGDMVQKIYCDFHAPVLRTAIRTAEMIKFASNAFLATRVSFINEIGNLCKKLGVDVYDVADGMGYDPRIGRSYLNAGVGFGGSCLPKDLEALVNQCAEVGEGSSLLSAVYQVNKAQPMKLMAVTRGILGSLQGKTVAVLGLAFKANTDDVRHAPALEVINMLLREGARVIAYDPKAIPKAREALPQEVEYGLSVENAIAGCDCVLILTEWDQFKDEGLYSDKVVIDGRRVLNPDRARRVCRHYEGVCW